jgi:hypothetical protein
MNLLSSSDDSFQESEFDILERNIPTICVVESAQPFAEEACSTKLCSDITADDLESHDASAASEQCLQSDATEEAVVTMPCDCHLAPAPCIEEAAADAQLSTVHRSRAADDFPESDNIQGPFVEDDPAPNGPCARYSYFLLVLLFGLFDGFAGVSAVLAVIPTVAMRRETAKASAYLGAFLATSILSTGALAAAWSVASRQLGTPIWLEFAFSAGASLVTIALGIAWEVLLSMDKLDIVFGA